MPLEVSPAPFLMQLPYTPKFIPETAAAQSGSVAGAPKGPVSATASAIIPPNPGGVATPHRAIPALAEAGYTSTTVRPQSMVMDRQTMPHQHGMYLPPGSAGGSLYEGQGGYGGGVGGFGPAYGPNSAQMPPPNPAMQNDLPMPRSTQALSTIHSEGWGSFSLPAPRPARISTGESVIAPRSRHEHHDHTVHGVHHHSHQHHHHGDSESGHERQHKGRYAHDDDDDAKSDGSYYAKPRHARRSGGRARSGSVSSVSPSESDGGEYIHRRSGSLGHHDRPSRNLAQMAQGAHQRSPSLQPNTYSPSSPSPLSLATGPPARLGHDQKGHPRSPLSPSRPRQSRHQSYESYRATDSERHGNRQRNHGEKQRHDREESLHRGRNPSSREDLRSRRDHEGVDDIRTGQGHDILRRRQEENGGNGEREASVFREEHGAPEPKERQVRVVGPDDEVRMRQSSKLPPVVDTKEKRDRHASLRPVDSEVSRREHHREESSHEDQGRERKESHHTPHSHHHRRASDRGYDSESEHHRGSMERQHRHHHRHHSTHFHPEDDYTSRRRTHSHSHAHHTHHNSDPHLSPYAQSGRGSPPPMTGEEYHPHLLKDPYRGRAVSMQFDHGPPPHPLGGAGPMSALGVPGVGDGTRPYNANLYQTPSVAGGSQFPRGEAYDDGASVAGSGLTFMDGPVGGRTSQYGLPKYAHQMKPDYRRFMVQRGNADVFLD